MPTTRSDATRHIALLCTTFNKPIEPLLVDGYLSVLMDLDSTLLRDAIKNLTATSQWMPRPAEIVSEVRRLDAEANPYQEETAHWRLDTYDCPKCLDTGYVTVWSPQAMKLAIQAVRDGALVLGHARGLYECVAKCVCEIGQKKLGGAATLRVPPMVVIDRRKTVAGRNADLLEWAAEHTGRIDHAISRS